MEQEKHRFYHLTLGGWVERNRRPANTVETWKRTEDRSGGGKLRIDHTREWVNPDWAAAAVKTLRDRFPMPESDVSAEYADIYWQIVD